MIAVQLFGETLSFWTDSGVFSSRRLDAGTELLLETLPPAAGRTVLDVGCGWGAIGLTLARLGRAGPVVLIDVNERAVRLTQQTAELWGVAVDVRHGDGYQALLPHERFDLIVTNPPVRAGKGTYYPWVAEAPQHLRPGGALWAVIRTKQGASSFAAQLAAHFPRARRQARRGGYEVWVGESEGV